MVILAQNNGMSTKDALILGKKAVNKISFNEQHTDNIQEEYGI
jgi:hypothetical protein